MLLIYGNHASWDGWTPEEYDTIVRTHVELQKELVESGEFVGAKGLTTLGAKTVRVEGGVPAVTDGPFTEAKEYLAGYYILDCESIDRVTEIAAGLWEAKSSPIEIRQFIEDDRMRF
ncbi:MAG TPA: YciI family protein [Streptosporangiaceae bacterium]|jgi:hypothetical protein